MFETPTTALMQASYRSISGGGPKWGEEKWILDLGNGWKMADNWPGIPFLSHFWAMCPFFSHLLHFPVRPKSISRPFFSPFRAEARNRSVEGPRDCNPTATTLQKGIACNTPPICIAKGLQFVLQCFPCPWACGPGNTFSAPPKRTLGEFIFGWLPNSHVVNCASRSFTWKTNFLCVIDGSAIACKSSEGIILLASLHKFYVARPWPWHEHVPNE